MKQVVAAALLVLAPSCQKAPAEPAPPAPPTTPAGNLGTVGTGAGTGAFGTAAPEAAAPPRCVVPLEAAAPPARAKAGDRCPKDPSGNLKLGKAPVAFLDAPKAPKLTVELADSPEAIERGLMYRKAMAEDEGMLFRMGVRKVQTFWMHNTCIPLDLVFVDDDGTIVGVAEAAPVLDDGVRSVACPSSYVLEVNAGFVRRHGVAPGQKIALP